MEMSNAVGSAYSDAGVNEIYVGLDLGQRVDHTAIAVVEKCEQPVAYLPPVFECMRVRYLERMPLGTSYSQVVERVSEIVRHPRLERRSRFLRVRFRNSSG